MTVAATLLQPRVQRHVVKLRPYQRETRQAVAEAWADPDRGHPLVVLPTGCGKTHTALSIVVDELEAGGRVVWLAHRTELLTQPMEALLRTWPEWSSEAGIVQAARDDAHKRIVFASVPTVAKAKRRSAILAHGAPTLVVVDEAHHSCAPSQRKAIDALGKVRRLGLTATPDRADGKDLGEIWEIAYSYPLTRAIDEGWLVPPFAAVAPVPDINAAKLARLSDEEMGEALIAAHIVEHTVEVLDRAHNATRLPGRDGARLFQTRGRRWFVFTASVEQARLTAEALTEAGWAARWACGTTPTDDRRRLLAALAAGKIEILVSPAIFTEGTDCPAVDGILLARACASWSMMVQCVGRGLRLFDPGWDGPGINAHADGYAGKRDCLVLDLAGASDVHDLRSAPVLIGGSKCPEAMNGVHDFAELDDGRGQCTLCEKRIPCFLALAEGETTHKWIDTEVRRCGHCDKPQCELSDDGRHAWQPLEDTQICLSCGLEIKLRDGMLRRAMREEDSCTETRDGAHLFDGDGRACSACGREAISIDAAWLRLPAVTPETWAVDIGDHGLVFVRVDRAAGTGEPVWLRKGGTKPRWLSPDPVALAEVRIWTDNLVKRAERTSSRKAGWRDRRPTERQIGYLYENLSALWNVRWASQAWQVYNDRGPTAGAVANEIARLRARARAVAVKIASEAR